MSDGAPIQFILNWIDNEGDAPVCSIGKLSVSLGGRPVWPAPGEPDVTLEIYADDLLSHLAEFWKPLMLRQTYPLRVVPDRPSKLRALAEQRWAELPAAVVEKEEERVTAFEQAHDLSRSFSGLFGLPPLYLFRTADEMLVDTFWGQWSVPYEAARSALIDVGDRIATRLEGRYRGKWTDLIASWRSRDQGEPARLLAWATGLNADVARSLVAEGALEAPESVTDASNDNDELRLAARMSSALPTEQIRQVLALVRTFATHQADALDHLERAASDYIAADFGDHLPFEQGEAAAGFAREYLGLASVQRVDVFALIEELGVELRAPAVAPPSLDGLAVWGPKHGPAVLINASSARVAGRGDLRNSGAARVTAAHELCHLLLDRRHALTAVDVLNSKMPAGIEKRARAFAGEFLLPGRVAADVWFGMGQPSAADGLRRCLDRLCATYGVTRSVAAWKLEHGLHWHDIDLAPQLDQVVPQRW